MAEATCVRRDVLRHGQAASVRARGAMAGLEVVYRASSQQQMAFKTRVPAHGQGDDFVKGVLRRVRSTASISTFHAVSWGKISRPTWYAGFRPKSGQRQSRRLRLGLRRTWGGCRDLDAGKQEAASRREQEVRGEALLSATQKPMALQGS